MYRVDDSRGPEDGFFADGPRRDGLIGVTPSRQLLILGLINFDKAR